MKVLDRNDPFFSAPWRRWLTVLAPGLWAAFELVTGSPGWALMFAAISAYATWELFLRR